jgi:hypothetical protein
LKSFGPHGMRREVAIVPHQSFRVPTVYYVKSPELLALRYQHQLLHTCRRGLRTRFADVDFVDVKCVNSL